MLGKNSYRNPGDSGLPGGGPKTGGPVGSEEHGGSISRNPFLKNLTHKTRRDGDEQPCSNRSKGQNTREVLRAQLGGRWTQTQSRKAERRDEHRAGLGNTHRICISRRRLAEARNFFPNSIILKEYMLIACITSVRNNPILETSLIGLHLHSASFRLFLEILGPSAFHEANRFQAPSPCGQGKVADTHGITNIKSLLFKQNVMSEVLFIPGNKGTNI